MGSGSFGRGRALALAKQNYRKQSSSIIGLFISVLCLILIILVRPLVALAPA